jgi:hypothetical protein
MKKILLFILLPFFQFFHSQVIFEPSQNHEFQNYSAIIRGIGTIYYTTDGTDPTINSSSGVNQVEIIVTQNLILKARLKNAANEISEVFSRPYYFGELPQKTVYFKPPPNWTTICSFMNYIQPNFLIDFFGPGNNMIPVCEGWYKSSFSFYQALVTFNNCKALAPLPIYEYYNVTADDTIFYDYSLGSITNPPACLLGVNDSNNKIAVVKVVPNPVQDFIMIASDKKFLSYEISDMAGKVLVQNNYTDIKINVAKLNSGVYFIRLKSFSQVTDIVKFIKK